MPRPLQHRRLTHLLAAMIVSAGVCGPAASAFSESLWRVVESAGGPGEAGVARSSSIAVNWRAVDGSAVGDAVTLALFDDRVVTAIIERRQETAPGSYVLSGRLLAPAAGTLTLAAHDSGLAGLVQIDVTTYRIRGAADGSVRLELIDYVALPWCDIDGNADRGLARDAFGPPVAAAGPCDDGSVIDLLVVYTREARDAAGGTDNILAEIDLMVANMNAAMTNSEVQPRMHIVYARELGTPQAEINLQNLAGRNDGVVDGVHILRDAYGGDEVALVRSGGGGVALGLWNLEPESEANMFCINGRDSMPFIVAHEVGHNLGCCHAREDGGGCPPQGGLLFPYSNGYRFFGDSGTQWRTVMAYQPGAWSALYSNPLVLFDGVPTGIPEGEQDSADNTKTINLAAFTVANFRCNDRICEDLDLPSDGDDCNQNDVPDLCEIALGLVEDVNEDGVPDECQCAGSGTLIEGTGETGDFNTTCGSDDSYWAAHGEVFAFQLTDPVVQFELTATAPAGFGGRHN